MKIKKILLGTVAFLLMCEALFLNIIPSINANGVSNPIEYSQDIDLNGLYIYNITSFGTEGSWYNYTWGKEGTFFSNSGGQIHVNFTGFYDRDPNDSGLYCDFPDTNMPWMDIKIFNYTSSGLEETFKIENRSNSEVANNLILNFFSFTSGFLVPLNLTWLNNTARAAATGVADLTVEETYHFIQFDFIQTLGGTQHTQLIYDKKTGLLVYGNTSLPSGYGLELFSLNFSLDYSSSYNYDVINFGGDTGWYNFTPWPADSFEGYYRSNPTGVIQVNFTGDYNKEINDWGNVFDDPIPWINISIYENNTGVLNNNFTLYNRSNSEAARQLLLGYENFQSGFLIPAENLTYIKELALKQQNGYLQGNVSILETPLTIKIKYNQYPSGQKTYMIYEKYTGLLLWANTTVGNYLLEFVIRGYIPWKEEVQSTGSIPGPSEKILFLPYLIVIIASLVVGIPLEFNPKFDMKTKKYLLVAMLGISSFSGLLFFNNNMNALINGNRQTQLKESVVDITLIVDYNNGTISTWANFTLDNYKITVYDALDKWCDVTLELTTLGYIVKVIDGISIPWVYEMTDKDGNPLYGLDVTKEVLDDGFTIHFHTN